VATKTRTFELAAFGFAVALVLLVEYFGQRAAATLQDAAEKVERTHQVIDGLNGLLVAELDAETGRRGYALTGDEALLAPYRNAADRVNAQLAVLRDLTNGDEEQKGQLSALEPQARTRLKLLDEAIDVRRVTGFDVQREATTTSRGSDEMVRLRAAVDAMVRAEQKQLVLREARTRDSVTAARTIQLASGALSVLLLVVVVFRLRREVASREASEERARENELHLATTLESIGDGVIATDADGNVQRMNPVAEAITGWRIEDAIGKKIETVFHLVHDVTGKEAVHPVARAMRDVEIVEIDDSAVLVAKDGTKRRVADSAAPIKARDGTVRGAVLVFRDITKTLENARALRRAHAFLDSVVENIPDMIFVKEATELAFVRFNRAGELLLGAKREELIGKTDFAFFPPDQAKAFVEKDRETLRGKKVIDIPEEPLTTSDGIRWLHTKKVPIIDEQGEPEYLLGISEDITERRHAEVLLRASMDATEIAHRELEAFSYSVAHDLRAPLRSIDGFSQALLDDYAEKLDDQGKNHLQRVRNAARRMAELIDDLLALARVSRTEIAREEVDLGDLARTIAAQAKTDYNVDAQLVVADGLVASADARLVRVLLENLLSNAFKFSSRRGAEARVEIGKHDKGGGTVFFIKDNGAGFDVDNAKKLFTAFQRYHRPTEFEGTGIGLATAERIVSRHGGWIWAESAPGEGATFNFTLERGDKKK
jgi:PAS domain S-box-containing protein